MVRAHFPYDSCGTNWAGQELSHPHEVVRRRGEGKHPADFVDPAMSHLPHQCDRLQPSEALLNSLALPLATSYPACRVVRSSIALPPLRLVFCAMCGVTF